MEKNYIAINKYLYFMWNAWSEEVCMKIQWNCSAQHIWSKWMGFWDRNGASGATAPFWGDLDGKNRQILFDYIDQNYRDYQK